MGKLNLEFCRDDDLSDDVFFCNLSNSTWNETTVKRLADVLLDAMANLSSADTALSMQRFFPEEQALLGVNASDLKLVADSFYVNFTAKQIKNIANNIVNLSEHILERAVYGEQVLLAFSLLSKVMKCEFDECLLSKFKYYLEHYACNWAHVDYLCIKALYQYLLKRPHLIIQTQSWSQSDNSWCRRASCVAWVKFIKRKMGKTEYRLDIKLIFELCNSLLGDEDVYVQKGIGWLLKVTAVEHPQAVIAYLTDNHKKMPRATVRYALEKYDKQQRASLLAEFV